MSTKRFSQHTSLKLSHAAPVPPLGRSDLRFMQLVLAEIAPGWTAQLGGICAYEATLVIVPQDGDDDTGPSFLISRETYGFRLDQVHWDILTEIGVYASLPDVVSVLRNRLVLRWDKRLSAFGTLH